MKLTICIPEKISLNKIYGGIHYSIRSRHKDDFHLAVAYAKGRTKYDGPFPVAVHYHFRLHGTALDTSNHAYMQKLVEDELVAAGVLPDDDPKYVGEIRITGEKIERADEDEVDVVITPLA